MSDEQNTPPASSLAQQLPAYSNQQKISKPKEFQFKVEKNGKAIVVLSLLTEPAISRTIPTYSDGSVIKGSVSLSLDQPDSIQSVDVTVQGQFITGVSPDDQINFIDISRTLWSRTSGAPCNFTATHVSTLSTQSQDRVKFTGKLVGEYSWPFAIEFPKKVVMPLIGRIELGSFAPPQTFNERDIHATIYYQISVRIVRGRFRTDRRLSTQIGYIPALRPPPFPPSRLMAYQKGTTLIGPTLNIDDWHSSAVTPVQGHASDSPIGINCTLFLSKPLAYTRGTLIPLCIKIEGNDASTLDLLSAPEAINVCLRRVVKYGIPEKKSNTKVIVYKEIVTDFVPAVWWPSRLGDETSSPLSEGIRYVNGEIHLKSDLKPTSDMPLLQVDYSVVLLPFKAAGIASTGKEVVLQVPVEIVTSYAPGPRPVKAAPPGYDANCGPTKLVTK